MHDMCEGVCFTSFTDEKKFHVIPIPAYPARKTEEKSGFYNTTTGIFNQNLTTGTATV